MKNRRNGFTIVELLIVIVVIAILATISIVAYTGIQARAHDTKRASDINQIKKALVAYNIMNGGVRGVPGYNSDGNALHSGWDTSTDANWLFFLRADYGNMPIDPSNTLPVSGNPSQLGNRAYYYYCYGAGSGPSPATANVRLGYHKSNGTQVNEDFAVTNCI